MTFDAIDTKLLKFLQTDAKQTTKQLSAKLNLSVTAVYERIKKLEREGIIEKQVVIKSCYATHHLLLTNHHFKDKARPHATSNID